ncbi:MAG: cytochrome c, partial [Planctomycetota bacterium]
RASASCNRVMIAGRVASVSTSTDTRSAAAVPATKACNTASTREEAQAVLQALVAGTAAADRVSVEVDTLATRPAIMTRLQEAEARLKAALANARGFKRRRGMIEREAEIIALQAAILTLPELDDAADDDYVAWCQELSQAAEAIAEAAMAADLDSAQQHFGTMQQSCTDCHEMYRG